MTQNKKVVVTGIGIISSIGNSTEEHLNSLFQGKSGKKEIERIDTSHPFYRNKNACVIDSKSLQDFSNDDETLQVNTGVYAVNLAINDAKLSQLQIEEAALVIGSSIGASHTFSQFFKEFSNESGNKLSEKALELASYSAPTITASIAKEINLKGPVCTISTACSASTNAVGRGLDMIRSGRVKTVIAGGVDIFSELAYSGFNCLQALATDNCSPFSIKRNGLMLGDASAFLILEDYDNIKDSDKTIYAEIVSYHFLSEAYHPTAVKEDGSSVYECMKRALEKGEVLIDQIDYINAHGTATNVNDTTELKGIELLLSESNSNKEVYVSSTKSMIGHCLGAAGSAELVSTILSMKHNFVLPNINVNKEDLIPSTNNKIKIPLETEYCQIEYAISNSFAFGGNMSSIVIKNLNKTN